MRRYEGDFRPRRAFSRGYDRSAGYGGEYGAGQAGPGRRPEGAYRYGAGFDRGPNPAERDLWWLGEREMRGQRSASSYDDRYGRFSAETHPLYSPIGGMHPAMGGEHAARRPPRPLRENTWFSDWTRWF